MPFASGITLGNSEPKGGNVFLIKHKGRRRKIKHAARRAGRGVIAQLFGRA